MEWYWILLIVLSSIVVLFFLTWIFYKMFFKRFWDLILSFLALIILSPLLSILSIAGAIAMRGNPFFTQIRPGKNEKLFKLIKFRSMSNKKDKNGVLLPDGERLNGYGRFIRKTSLDELLEIVNVFLGQMSFVGPRPLLVEYLPYYTGKEKHRHDVRPGLTGLAQVTGRNNLQWDKRLSLDVEYVNNFSVFLDIKLIFLTIIKVFLKKNIFVDSSAEGNLADIRKNKRGLS